MKIREKDVGISMQTTACPIDERDLYKMTYSPYFDYAKVGISYLHTRKKMYMSKIKKVIFNNPATIIFWSDGDKTVVKCDKDDKYDPEKGLAMAITKKFFDNNGFYYDILRKWLPKDEENEQD